MNKVTTDKKVASILLALPFIVYLIPALSYINLPGLYFDSVNPDYMALYLKLGAEWVPKYSWIGHDNFLFPDYPVLNSPYGGNVIAYIAYLFCGLFGYSLFTIRILHVIFGLVLLLLFLKLLDKSCRSRANVLASTCMLAALPIFVFSWRTQYYIQIFTWIFVLSAYLLCKDTSSKVYKYYFVGFLLGFASYSYFIYLIYAFIFLVLHRFFYENTKNSLLILSGLVTGFFPLIYGHISIFVTTGLSGYKQTLDALQSTYSVLRGMSDSFAERYAYLKQNLFGLLTTSNLSEIVMKGAYGELGA